MTFNEPTPFDFSGPIATLDALKQMLEKVDEYMKFLQKDRNQFANRVGALENEITELRAEANKPPTNPLVKTPEPIEVASDKPADMTPRVKPSVKQTPEDKTVEKTMTRP